MKKTSYFYLIMTILFSLLGCCSPEEAQPQPEPQKKYSYTVNITNASDFSGCTFEYIFYVDGEKEDVQSTADSCVTFTTLKEGSVKVDVTAKNSSGKVVGNRIGKTCYATTSVLLPFEEVAVLDSISILTPESYVYEGESVKLTIKALYSDGSDRDVTTSAFYTSDDSSILTVSNIGEVTGVKKGIATIKVTYTCEGVTKEDSINFEVLDKDEPIPTKILKSIELSKKSVVLAIGDNASLNVSACYEYEGKEGSIKLDVTTKAQFTSSNVNIVSVDGNGLVTAVSGGSAEINVSYTENDITLTETCDVTVKTLSSISFDNDTKTMALKSVEDVFLMAEYTDGTMVNIADDASFSSSDNNIVSVSGGMFEAKAVGTATITATYSVGGVSKTAEIEVTVTNDKVLDSIMLDVSGTENTYTLKVTAKYSDGSTKDVTSSSEITLSNENIATVSGGVLTAKTNGKVVINVEFTDIKTVSSNKELEVKISAVTLSGITANLSATSLDVGKTADVTVNAVYSDGSTKDVTSEAKLVLKGTAATLSGTTITGASAGKVSVTITYEDKETTVSLTVKQAINGYRVHFYGASWSTYKIYYYNSDKEAVSVWDSMPSMKSETDGHFYDLTESWVAAGKTMVIFYGGDNNNRYPADQQPGVALPSGTNEAWFNFATKEFETTNPFSTDPAVGLSPSGNVQFSSAKQSVTLSAKYCTTAKYTIDGSDPKTSGTAYTDGQTISVGESLSIGQSVTVKVWGTDGSLESTASATFTKVDKPTTPTRLGAYYTSTSTSFSIWSPDSSNVTVTVTPKGGTAKEYTCTAGFKVDGGYPDTANIYGVSVSGDLHLAEYQFKINGKVVRDPYGVMIKYDGNQQKTNQLSSGTENKFNYTSYAGPSANIVIDLDQTDPEGGWAERPKLDNRNDAIVYEVHVGDFTSDATWGGTAKNAGKFPGMVETGTKYSGVSTGIDHLKELGVTHVQLLPFYDYATKHNTTLNDIYNWGYDPVNYNVPEDRFSTCPSDYVERIREVKEMINEFHKNGIRVIMDVVYNHTFDKEMFKNISGKYYTSTDLSGCGNSTNTGVPMVSRMIRDSLEYWVDEYNIDGFRFDLIGIYHTSAVKDWGNYMNNTKFPDRMLLMYGEPWNGYATDNEESQKVRMSAVSSLTSAKVGVFNGKYRQSLKGSNDTGKRGYIFNQNEDDGTAYAANIAVGLKGSLTSLDKSNCSDISGTWTRFFAGTPDQSINYISAHDNLCLWDKIKEAGVTGDYAQRIVKFGHGILLVSQGIPFIHAGDEFLRTKHKGAGSAMAHNSYMAGIKTNSIDWSLKSTNNGIFKYHSDLIKLRKDNDGLRYRNGTGTTEVTGNAVKYYVQNTNGTKLCIVVNPGNEISNPVGGTIIFDANGATPKSSQCEGTAVTVIRY